MDELPSHVKEIYDSGCRHRDALLTILGSWPVAEYSKLIAFRKIDGNLRNSIKETLITIRQWLNTAWVEILQDRSFSDRRYLTELFQSLEIKMKTAEYLDTLTSDVEELIDDAL